MILSPHASYVTFKDNRKTDGYRICRQCKYHLCRVEIPTMASANNNMYGLPPKYLRDLSHVEAAFISPARSYGYVFTYMGRETMTTERCFELLQSRNGEYCKKCFTL